MVVMSHWIYLYDAWMLTPFIDIEYLKFYAKLLILIPNYFTQISFIYFYFPTFNNKELMDYNLAL